MFSFFPIVALQSPLSFLMLYFCVDRLPEQCLRFCMFGDVLEHNDFYLFAFVFVAFSNVLTRNVFLCEFITCVIVFALRIR